MRAIARAWWPLAASWLLMSAELPAISAVLARLPDSTTQLAAYGGVVFPVALIIEAPIIMLLVASTTLSRDAASYRALRGFMHRSSALLTLLHLLLAVTPLYDLVVVGAMDVPAQVVEPARTGLLIMLPWTWSIAFRRFQQGALIRFGHAREVTVGTALRLATNATILLVGLWLQRWPGIVVATSAVASGVLVEAVYAGVRVRPVVRAHLDEDRGGEAPLRGRAFAAFYVPLALTSLITLAAQPLCAAGIARMPRALESLAVWPVVTGVLMLLQAMGLAFTEVVVSMVGRAGAVTKLRRFSRRLALATGGLVLVLASTPLAEAWFAGVSALEPELAAMASGALWWAIPIPAMRALQSWYQGLLVHARRTAAITESVILFFAVSSLALGVGIWSRAADGLIVALASYSLGRVVQTVWLRVRSRASERRLDAMSW